MGNPFRRRARLEDIALIGLLGVAAGSPEYDDLKRLAGRDVAVESVRDFFFFLRGSRRDQPRDLVTATQLLHLGNVEDILLDHLRKDVSRFIASKMHIENLLRQAQNRQFSDQMRSPRNVLPPQDYHAVDRDNDFTKAAKWIVYCSNSEGSAEDSSRNSPTAVYIDELKREVGDCSRPLDFRTVDRLWRNMARRDGFDLDRRRRVHNEGPYTGSGLGLALAKFALQTAHDNRARIYANPLDDPKDLGCFLLGSFLRAHGFSDGNGRASRMLYALALLRNIKPFVAPSKGFTDQLFGPDPAPFGRMEYR